MDKCDICRVYTKRPVTIAREDRKTLEKIEYKICHVCMYADKRTVEQKFSYIQENLKHRGNFQISSSRHRPKENK